MKLQMDWPDPSLQHHWGTRELLPLRPTSQIQACCKKAFRGLQCSLCAPADFHETCAVLFHLHLAPGQPGLAEHTPAWLNTSAGEGGATCPASALSKFALNMAEGQI